MHTAYTYSASRVRTLEEYLLTRTDIDRLLVAKPGADLASALKETYLAPYLLRVGEERLSDAIELTLVDAKRLIHRIAPQGDMFRVLWVQYDVHNLRVFARALSTGTSFTDCESYCSTRGIYEPSYLFAHAEQGTLDRLQPGWHAAFEAALRHANAGELDRVDGVLDGELFASLARIARAGGDAFLSGHVAAVIDLYNCRARLRVLTNPAVASAPGFVEGGSFSAARLDTREQVAAALAQLRDEEFWKDAFAHYDETGHTTRLDARFDEYLTARAAEASVDVFSSASLVRYYLLCRQAAANVRTIVVGRNSGMSDADIRANLRLTYVHA